MTGTGHGLGVPVAIAGLSAVAAAFDGFIVDQWGVLHDGARPYVGAAECLARLRAQKKRVVILSNSGKREAENVALMARLGFAATLFDRFISAGEEAREAIETRREPFHRALGRRCYAFTRDGDHSVLDGIGIVWVDRIEDADFLAAIGTDSPRRTLGDYEGELKTAAARRLPMLCCNPDLQRLSPHGTIEAPGVLVRRYEALGGTVFYHGKPYLAIYRTCLATLACPPERVLAVGDSLEHDILGATRVGLRSALVTGGVHAAALGAEWGRLPSASAWERMTREAPASPDYLLPAFVW